jgi:hypothetical protein
MSAKLIIEFDLELIDAGNADGTEMMEEVSDAVLSVAENIRKGFGASLVNSPVGGFPVGYYKFYITDAPLVMPEVGLPINQFSRDNVYVQVQTPDIYTPLEIKNKNG